MRMMILLLALQGADAELDRLEDWAKTQPDNAPGCIGVGDGYYQAAKKFPKDRQRFMDKANEWWAKGWPNLDAFWVDKTRESLRKIYAVGQGSHAIQGWKTEKISASGERVHSGAFAVKVPMYPHDGYFQPLKIDLKLPAGAKELEVSAWVLSDGTDSDQDDMKPHVTDRVGHVVSANSVFMPKDFPIWSKISAKINVDGADKCCLYFEFASRKGTVFIDDVSAKADGKELIHDGGFEAR